MRIGRCAVGELRQKFEETPKTKELLHSGVFVKSNNTYKLSVDGCLVSVIALNARWEAYQEQQSKIEQLEKINAKNQNTLQHLEYEYLRVVAENKALRGEHEQ